MCILLVGVGNLVPTDIQDKKNKIQTKHLLYVAVPCSKGTKTNIDFKVRKFKE